MTDCKHGLEIQWCALCAEKIEVRHRSDSTTCCAPKCKRTADKRVGVLPLCPRHYHQLERQVARVHKPDKPFQIDTSKYRLGWVYFAEIGDTIKIGHSMEPKERVKSFASYVADTGVRLIAVERGDRAKEKRLHRKFAEHRIVEPGKSVELFAPAPAIFKHIESGRQCSAFSKGLKQCRRLVSDAKSLTCVLHDVSDATFDPEDMPTVRLFMDSEIPHEDVA